MYQDNSSVSRFFKNSTVNTLLLFGMNTGAFALMIGALKNVLPIRLEMVSDLFLPLCIIGGIISTMFSRKEINKTQGSRINLGKNSAIFGISFLVLITLYLVSYLVVPVKYITMEQFENAGLTQNQVAQMQKILDTEGYISIKDLDSINLTIEQKNAVIKVLNELGYTTTEDVEGISQEVFKTQIALVATQTAVAKITSCNITPNKGLPLVSIRNSNSTEAKYIGSLAENQILHVVGHDGGTVNQDRWWLIEQNIGGEVVYGWIASWVVEEINEVECMRVERAPGSD